jgi:hypothetical protein
MKWKAAWQHMLRTLILDPWKLLTGPRIVLYPGWQPKVAGLILLTLLGAALYACITSTETWYLIPIYFYSILVALPFWAKREEPKESAEAAE